MKHSAPLPHTIMVGGLMLLLTGLSLSSATNLEVLARVSASVELSRPGRQLAGIESLGVPPYLLPTYQPPLCSGAHCCQEDDYASPYRIRYLNRTATALGGRTYTTFFFNVLPTYLCQTEVDHAGCCEGSISALWVDVDPNLKVKFASFADSTIVDAEQSQYGFQMNFTAIQYADVPAAGLVFSITVEGAPDFICPLPSYGPIPGTCDVVVMGSSSKGVEGACCPKGLSLTQKGTFVPPTAFTCVSDIQRSGFRMQLENLTFPYVANGELFSNYTFRIQRNPSCTSDSITACCNMNLSYLQLKISQADVTSVFLGGTKHNFTTAPWNEPNSAGYQGLLLEDLDIAPGDVKTSYGIDVTLTVRLPPGSQVVPEICNTTQDSDTIYGPCQYFLHSDDGFCCPAGKTSVVEIGTPTKPPPPPVPPAGTCSPTDAVAITDTSMSLLYNEHLETSAASSFVFLLSNNNNPSCAKKYCTDVCSWTLFINPAIVPLLSYKLEEPANSNNYTVTTGSDAAVTFTYGPSGTDSFTYTIIAPPNTNLASLCRANAWPGQTKTCAAVVRSQNVYAVVFFNESDLIMHSPPPPAPTCLPMASSCVRVDSATFNSPDDKSTVFDFGVVNHSNDGSCLPDINPAAVTFRLLLQPSVVSELQASNALSPAGSATFNSSSVVFGQVPVAAAAKVDYKFSVAGVKTLSDICVQSTLPDQPADTCLALFEGPSTCFRGFVKATKDPNLVFNPAEGGSSNKAGVIVPAVVVPIVVLAIIAALAYVYKRRRQYAPDSQAGDLQEQLRDGASQGSQASLNRRSQTSMPSRAPSDVHISVSSARQ